jgi:deoxyribonuclease V
MAHAAVAVYSFPDLRCIEHKTATLTLHFPYVPGLLTFREGPAVLRCFGKLETGPDLVLFDGQGLLHPRRMGLATHLGILLGTPSVGCAKSRLYGTCEEPAADKGSCTRVRGEDGAVLGVCLRTRESTRPLFVSVGSNVSLDQAVETVLQCCTRYRSPEPLRAAHRFADTEKKRKKRI